MGPTSADLVIVGGGFTGLWTALLATDERPGLDVVILEADRVAEGASGRNGGFVAASITHGFGNGLSRWPNELPELLRQGHENLDELEATILQLGLQVDWSRTGELDVATEDYQVAEFATLAATAAEHGEKLELLDGAATRRMVDSPLYRAGLYDRTGVALVDPARLSWELARVARSRGVRIHEHSAALGIERTEHGVQVRTEHGSVHARQAALGTSAFPNLLRRVRPYVIPVYDYVLMTEPLSSEQWASVGWGFGGGVGDSNNQFHYTRPTADGRILWGGFEAVYHYGSRIGRDLERDDRTYAVLAENFFTTFPQLEGLRFTHAWGGAIDTCSRFSAFWGTAMAGRVAYSLGYTGLGVAATRYGARVMLDLLAERQTERTRLEMVRSKPIPFPPEPVRSPAVALTRWSLDRADNRQGRRNAWLRTLDRLGLGFDS
ncbi:MAG TPA: FAD-dependent oxidoreductase [Candidatus Nanopelagicales bacterium]